MKMSLDGADGTYRIQGYGEGEIRINEVRYRESLLVTPDTLITEWGPRSVATIGPEDFRAVHDLDPEVVLLGTGEQQTFPGRELMLSVLETGVGLEVMDTASACRTYNVLMSEGRRVVAALIIDQGR
jgi:uncharacterized protein